MAWIVPEEPAWASDAVSSTRVGLWCTPEPTVGQDVASRHHGDRRGGLTEAGSPEAIEGALATDMIRGAIQTWDRLETLLAKG
jgi:hypothetical protein